MLIDTHAHLQDEEMLSGLEAVLDRAKGRRISNLYRL